MATEVSSLPSSAAQLIMARETSIGVLPGNPQFFAVDVNEYGDFGSNQELLSRRVISQRRRRLRGDIVSEEVNAGFTLDFTPTMITHLMPSIMLTDPFEQPSKGTVFDAGLSVAGTPVDYDIGADAAAAGWGVGHLLYAEGFTNPGNNGLKEVTGIDGTTIEVSGLVAEASPPDEAVIRAVGVQFGAAELDVVKSPGQYPVLSIVSGSLSWSNFRVEPGSRIFIGGTAAANRFVGAANNGWARVLSVSPTALTLDRVDGGADDDTDMSSETGTGLSIQVFLSDKISDVQLTDALYNRISNFIERRLGEPNPVGSPGIIQTEDLLGTVSSTAVISVENQSKSTVEVEFIGIESDEHTGAVNDERTTDGETILSVPESGFLNNSSHVVRSLLSRYTGDGDGAPDVLINFVSEYEISLSNNASIIPAVGRKTGFDVNTGDFIADVSLTNYFTSIETRKAIRANDRIQFELAWQRAFNGRQVAVMLDFPSCSLGGGQVEAEIDQVMSQPLTVEAASSDEHDLTISYSMFWFIPS